jgi:hypothetical protein
MKKSRPKQQWSEVVAEANAKVVAEANAKVVAEANAKVAVAVAVAAEATAVTNHC